MDEIFGALKMMAETRKKAVAWCLCGIPVCTIVSAVGFFMFFGLPFVAIAVPAPIWTFWGFLLLSAITNTEFPADVQVKASALNFFFVLSVIFACQWIMEIGEDFFVARIVGILAFVCLSAAELWFWIRFLMRYFPAFKANMKKRLENGEVD